MARLRFFRFSSVPSKQRTETRSHQDSESKVRQGTLAMQAPGMDFGSSVTTQVESHSDHNRKQMTICVEYATTAVAFTKPYQLSKDQTIADLKTMIARDLKLPAEFIGLSTFPLGGSLPRDLPDSDLVSCIPDRTKVRVHDKKKDAVARQRGEPGDAKSDKPHENHIKNNEHTGSTFTSGAVMHEESNTRTLVAGRMTSLAISQPDGRPVHSQIEGNRASGQSNMCSIAGNIPGLWWDNNGLPCIGPSYKTN